MWEARKDRGFTIVELLIVVVVIAILAVITVVAYNGVQDRAKTSRAASVLTQASKKVKLWSVSNNEQYPATLAEVGITDTADTAYQYTSDNTVSPATFCVSVTMGGASFYQDSSSAMQSGICPGHNLLVWNEPQASTSPVPGATIDTTIYRSASASIRLGPSQVGRVLLGNPYTGVAGQVYTVSLWIQTDATWNGTGGNSKIRFGNGADGALLTACSYHGPKATWTKATCSYTLTAAVTSVSISVGNDGTTGNIWLDDITVSRT